MNFLQRVIAELARTVTFQQRQEQPRADELSRLRRNDPKPKHPPSKRRDSSGS